jgi:hypothetical protein
MYSGFVNVINTFKKSLTWSIYIEPKPFVAKFILEFTSQFVNKVPEVKEANQMSSLQTGL